MITFCFFRFRNLGLHMENKVNISYSNMQPRNLRYSAFKNWDKYVSFECLTFLLVMLWVQKIITSKKSVLFFGQPGIYESKAEFPISYRFCFTTSLSFKMNKKIFGKFSGKKVSFSAKGEGRAHWGLVWHLTRRGVYQILMPD